MRVFLPCVPRFALAAGLGLLVSGPGSSAVLAQDRGTKPDESTARIVDSAHMFDSQVVDEAEKTIRSSAEQASIPVFIETMDSLRGESIEDVTAQHARRSGREGLYILLARKDRRIDVRVSDRFQEVVREPARKEIQNAFIDGLHNKGPDEGLREGVKVLQRVLAQTAGGRKVLYRNVGVGGQASPLVVRNQVRLTLGGARRILEGAEAKAAEMGLKMNIAVVDDGGHLLAFARMDGARPASGYTAMTKATTAATFRQETGPLSRGSAPPDPLLNLSLQNAALASGGKLTTLFGGVPVLVDGQVIGGVGVGGGTGEQDAVVAKAGIEALSREIPASEAPRER